jgi:hypothetical protein
MKEIKNKLVALEAKVDAKLFGNWYAGMPPRRVPADITDEELDKLGGVAANPARLGVTAATLGAGYGGLVADRAIMNRYGGGGSGMAVRGAAYRSAGRDAMESGRFMGNRAINAGNDGFRAGQRSFRATKPGAIGNRKGKTGLLGRLRKAVGKGVAVATGGKVRFEDQVKARIEFMIPGVIPMMGRGLLDRIGSGINAVRRSPMAARNLGASMRRPGLVGAAALGGVGMVGGALKAATDGDPNTGVLGGALGGAIKGAAVGGLGGMAVGGGSALARGSALAKPMNAFKNPFAGMRPMGNRTFSEVKKRLIELSTNDA